MKRNTRGLTALGVALALAAVPAPAPGQTVSGESTALTINGSDRTLAEFNYYFNSWYASYTEENAAYLPYMFDESVSLKEQSYSEEQTWFDFFVDEAAESMQQIVTLSEAAREAGYTLSPAKEAQIASVQDTVASFAGSFGADTDAYLALFYGEGMDSELFTQCLTDARLADGYADQVREAIDPSSEEIEAYYREHTRDFVSVAYERFFARASAMGTIPEPREKEAAHRIAADIDEKVRGGESLETASEPYRDKGAYVTFDDAQYLDGSVYGDWLFDPEREDGDVLLVEEVNGWYVMVFHARNEADYLTAHVLDVFFPLDEADGTADEQMEASCERAEALKENWSEEGAARETFARMAAAQAETTDLAWEYPSLPRGRYEDNIDNWLFADGRTEGDCEVMYSTEGFHVLYYAGEGAPAWQALAKESLQEEEYRLWFDELMAASDMIRHEDVLVHAGGY